MAGHSALETAIIARNRSDLSLAAYLHISLIKQGKINEKHVQTISRECLLGRIVILRGLCHHRFDLLLFTGLHSRQIRSLSTPKKNVHNLFIRSSIPANILLLPVPNYQTLQSRGQRDSDGALPRRLRRGHVRVRGRDRVRVRVHGRDHVRVRGRFQSLPV